MKPRALVKLRNEERLDTAKEKLAEQSRLLEWTHTRSVARSTLARRVVPWVWGVGVHTTAEGRPAVLCLKA